MKESVIQKITSKVCAKYPKLSGKRPKVSEQAAGRYLLVYSFEDNLPGGKSILQNVRVVSDEEGNISKMSSSRG